MLDQGKVSPFDNVLLGLFSVIQGYLLGRLEKAGMGEAELALKSCCKL